MASRDYGTDGERGCISQVELSCNIEPTLTGQGREAASEKVRLGGGHVWWLGGYRAGGWTGQGARREEAAWRAGEGPVLGQFWGQRPPNKQQAAVWQSTDSTDSTDPARTARALALVIGRPL